MRLARRLSSMVVGPLRMWSAGQDAGGTVVTISGISLTGATGAEVRVGRGDGDDLHRHFMDRDPPRSAPARST
jgi:hypothetical protein